MRRQHELLEAAGALEVERALALAALPIALLGVGGLRSLQTASLVASLPLLGVGLLLAISLRRALREDFG